MYNSCLCAAVYMNHTESEAYVGVFPLSDYIQPHDTNQVSAPLIIDWRKSRKGAQKIMGAR